MESELWKACTEGNVEAFRELLAGAGPVDIEAKGASHAGKYNTEAGM